MPVNTDTRINDPQGNNKTGSHLSTNIIIKVDGNTVGAVQSLSITETRGGIKQIDEVGTDGHIDSAPNQSTNITGNCTRVRFDRMRIAEAFSRPFHHVHAQRVPFDIEVHDVFHDADENNAIITVVKNVWISKITYDYQTQDYVISDQMDWEAEAIFSVLNNSNVVGTTMADGRPLSNLNVFEKQADRGVARGSLAFPGMLNVILGDPQG